MKLEKVLPYIILLPLIILQLTIIPFLIVWDITPSLITIFVVYYGIKKGQIFGMTYGFIAGLFLDLASGGIIGSAMFAKTLSGFAAGYFHPADSEENSINLYAFILIMIFCSSIDSFFYSLLGSSDIQINVMYLVIEKGILPGLYTTVVSIPLLLTKYVRVVNE